ncbi:hypothetical protein B0O99DRAFT_377762 [Bisporella sp. PMI_857]|nr:hypothetical protein B0O99DRAFT_377762 [Bisporella sp. PMI_857]
MLEMTPLIKEDTLGIHILWPKTNINQDFDLDIVAIHGLGGDSFKTWTEGNPRSGILWLSDLLPDDLGKEANARARIMTFGYNANLILDPAAGRTATFALELLYELRSKRQGSEQRPIIFVAHSLGGIVLKSALITALTNSGVYGSILQSTRSVLFLGTPHHGVSNLAGLAQLLTKISSSLRLRNHTFAAEELRLWSPTLVDGARRFSEIISKLHVYSFFETNKTNGVQVC